MIFQNFINGMEYFHREAPYSLKNKNKHDEINITFKLRYNTIVNALFRPWSKKLSFFFFFKHKKTLSILLLFKFQVLFNGKRTQDYWSAGL